MIGLSRIFNGMAVDGLLVGCLLGAIGVHFADVLGLGGLLVEQALGIDGILGLYRFLGFAVGIHIDIDGLFAGGRRAGGVGALGLGRGIVIAAVALFDLGGGLVALIGGECRSGEG